MALAGSLLGAMILVIALVETAVRLPLVPASRALLSTTARSLRVMRSAAISDHWKERALLAYSGRTLRAVGRFGLCVLALGLVATLVIGLVGLVVAPFAEFVLSLSGIVITTVLAFAWYALRGRLFPALPSDSAYSPLAKLLHHLALGLRPVAEMFFDLDQKMARAAGASGAEARTREHVFVAGLARAGTTILMRRIHASGAFRSLTYADMPFVLAPNFWRKLRGEGAKIEAHERVHGDGIAVDGDSPESLDEAFWRVFDGEAYIGRNRLLPHAPDARLLTRFSDYVAAILAGSDRTRYLSKNNNNILRLPALAATFPQAHILVPFRDPLAQAASLRAQHRAFHERQATDRFARAYMGWLVHHEFGEDHRPFATHAPSDHTSESLAYWLDHWCGVHEYLLDQAPDTAHFVCYEDLCTDPAAWVSLAQELGIDPAAGAETESFEHRPREIDPEDTPQELLDRAARIYAQLRYLARPVDAAA